MQLTNTFSDSFDSWYNSFNHTENGRKLLDIEGISRRCLDIGQMSHSYFTENFVDVTIDANANSGESKNPNAYGAEIVKGVQKLEGLYLLHRYAVRRFGLEHANKLLSAVIKGSIYMHDSTSFGIQVPYCTSMSTTQLMNEGRPYGQLKSLPPKRADSFIGQVAELCMDASQEFSGAIAIGDLIVNYCYYAKKEGLSDSDIKNHLQRLVHIVNNKFRIASQSPFTNISIFDKINLEKLFGSYMYPDGSKPDFDYIMSVQKLFCDWFALGDPSTGMPYRFPIVTINLHTTNGIIDDPEFLEWVSKVNCNTGCYNLYINSGNKISSCCRLLNNLDDMPRIDTFGNGSIGSIGSIRVVTLNLPRIALKANGNKEKFFVELHKQLCNSRDLLQVQREDIIYRRIASGFLKFFEPMKWLNIKRYFSTFGIIGVFEANEFMNLNIQSEEGITFTTEVLQFIEAFAKKTSKELGYPMNVEEIPGESVATKFVQKDRVLFGEDKVPFELYSNQYIPLIADVSLPERIELTGHFMELLSGGGILHLNLKDKITDPKVMKHLIEYSVSKNVTHLSVNYSFGQCTEGHVTVCGNSDTCSICGQKITSHMTRIVGYFTLTSSWGKQRREYEFPRRIFS